MPVSTREERRQQRRTERQAAQKKAAQREQIRRWGVLGGGLAVIVIAAVLIVVFAMRGGTTDDSAKLPGTKYDDPKTASGGLYTHVADTQPVTYDQTPPNHGDHYANPMPWGAYDTQVQEGRFVHNLEHGGIVILYHCAAACPDVETQAKNLMNTLPKEPKFNEVKAVVSPYDKSTHLISVLAWDWEQDFDTFDFEGIKAFYNAHVNKGPEAIP